MRLPTLSPSPQHAQPEEGSSNVSELLYLFADGVKELCDGGGRTPREVCIMTGLLFDVWEQWEAMKNGERCGIAAMAQLVDRLGRKSKNAGIIAQATRLRESLMSCGTSI